MNPSVTGTQRLEDLEIPVEATTIALAGQLTTEPAVCHDATRRLFSTIAPCYDRLNGVLSLRLDQHWRACAARCLARHAMAVRSPSPSESGWTPRRALRILDLCAGTGELALACGRALREKGLGSTQIIAADFARPMLDLARRKPAGGPALTALECVESDAHHLPFADGAFDAAAMAFGLRNLADRPRGLRELARVIRPGGCVVVLEFSRPRRWWLRSLYRPYLAGLVPTLGNRLSGTRAYGYLASSVEGFPPPETVNEWFRVAGLRPEPPRPLTGGIVTLYVARR